MTEGLNFLLTNRIPRQALTRFMGWFSQIEQPLVRNLSIAAWRSFADLRLHEAKKARFSSLHDCFIRELKEGARPVNRDPAVLVSPCDAIVGASGSVEGTRVFQAKGFPYTLEDLLGDAKLAAAFRDATYVTLRITSSMYHRFHAPHDCRVMQVTYSQVTRGTSTRPRCGAWKGSSARTSAPSCARAWKPLDRSCCSCPSPRCWWRASACTFSTCCCTSSIAGPTSWPAMRASPRARRWVGSSTAPRF